MAILPSATSAIQRGYLTSTPQVLGCGGRRRLGEPRDVCVRHPAHIVHPTRVVLPGPNILRPTLAVPRTEAKVGSWSKQGKRTRPQRSVVVRGLSITQLPVTWASSNSSQK